jgi:AcrR family transcriptional regulator
MAMSSEEREKRRREILAAATEVFIEKGFAGASLREIAARAHASKETLYAWFGNKTQLISVLIEEGMKQIGSRVSSEVARGTPESVLYVIALEVLRMINLSPLMRLFNAAAADARNSPELREILVARALNHSGVARYLEVCRSYGIMKFDDAERMASIFIAMVQAEYPAKLSLGVIDRISDAEIETHAKLVAQMFMKAVAPASKS